jgi:hypothetical protein
MGYDNCQQYPRNEDSGQGNNTYQLQINTPSTTKTWEEVIKYGGINIQIILGNSNLGLTELMKARGERQGGAVQRLVKKEGDRERGMGGRGKGGLEKINNRGNC